MTTLILGCGYLGRRVARALIARGERVFATTRSRARARDLLSEGIEPVVADVLEPETLSALPSVDRALYCVGFDRSAGVPLRTVYVDGLRHALGKLANRSRRLVYAGSTGVFGDHGGDWVDEETPPGPLTESGRACLEAEAVIREFSAIYRFPATILRYAGLYGPGRLMQRAAIEAGEPLSGYPGSFLNLIHIDDAASAALLALVAGSPGPLYLATDDRPVERGTFYARLAELLDAPPPRFAPPAPGEAPTRASASKRVRNRRIRDELGFAPAYPDFETGLPASLDEERRAGPSPPFPPGPGRA